MNPTTLSVRELRRLGYTCEVVERYNSFTKRKNDLFGFIDILAVKDKKVIGIQATSRSNISTRLNKIVESELYPLIKYGIHVLVWGWYKDKNRWNYIERDVQANSTLKDHLKLTIPKTFFESLSCPDTLYKF